MISLESITTSEVLSNLELESWS